MNLLELDQICVDRGGRRVLDRLSHSFAPGQLTAVIGPNGAGKSSLLEAAAGLLPIASGAILLDGVSLTGLSRRRLAERRAFLPQRAAVDWPISVERVVALGMLPQLPAFGGLPATLQPAIDRALAECDLEALRDRPATSLSGGELARTMLARAIVGSPDLLIVDEPTAGLDPRHAFDAMRRLRTCADAGQTIIVAIHDLDLALRFADQVVALKSGHLLFSGPARTIVDEKGLGDLYDVRVRILRDEDGASVRLLDPL